MHANEDSSNRFTFAAVLGGVFGVNAVAYPFWATCLSATTVYIGVGEEAIRWMIYSSAIIALPSILVALPAIRCFGLASCTKWATALSLLGCSLRAVAVANGHGPRRSTSAYVWVQLGGAVTCTALAPMAVCGSLIACTGSSKRARLWRHIAVTMANPLGLAVGALLPELVKHDRLLTAAEADAVLLLFMAIAAATLLSTLILLWRANASIEADPPPERANSTGYPSEDLAMDSLEPPQGSQVGPAADQSKAAQQSCSGILQTFIADVFPQLLKLLRTPKFILVAISFAFLLAPMLAAVGGMSVILPYGELLHSLTQQLVLAAFVVTGVLAPFAVPRLFWDRHVGAVALVAAHFIMVALALAYAFALAFANGPEEALPHALVAVISLAAAVTAALDLERAVDIMRRERPAVVAGLMWLAASGMAVVVCGVQEALLFKSPATATVAMQSWKWSMVLCFAVGAGASVAGVWISTNQAEASRGSAARQGSRGEDTAVVEGSCTIDAMHSGSSHPKAVWWQNAAASSEGAPHEAAAYVLRSGP